MRSNLGLAGVSVRSSVSLSSSAIIESSSELLGPDRSDAILNSQRKENSGFGPDRVRLTDVPGVESIAADESEQPSRFNELAAGAAGYAF